MCDVCDTKTCVKCDICHMPYLFLVLRFKSLSHCLKSGIQGFTRMNYMGCCTYFLSQSLYPSCVTHVTSHLVTRISFVFWPIAWAHSFLLRENNHLIKTDKDQSHQSILKHIKECSYTLFGKRDVCDIKLAKSYHFKSLSGLIMGVGDSFRLNDTQRGCTNTLKPKKNCWT